MVWLKLQWW
jgi:hypothetical protein